LERDILQDVKKKITEIKLKQKIATSICFVGIVIILMGFIIGILLVNPTILGVLAQLGLLIFLISGCIWIYFSTEKSKIIRELKTYLAMKELKSHSREHEDWELIQELLSD
jgi:amino acid permease